MRRRKKFYGNSSLKRCSCCLLLQGKDHVTAFWKCQMLAMIRKLEESQAPNCKELTVASLDSHTACYERTSSFCKVTLSDVTTLKDIFTAGGTDGFSTTGLSQVKDPT